MKLRQPLRKQNGANSGRYFAYKMRVKNKSSLFIEGFFLWKRKTAGSMFGSTWEVFL